MKKLFVIIPCFNNFSYTKRCLYTLLDTTKDCNVIIVDDASTDDTNKYFTANTWDNVFYVKNTTNQGVNKSWNIGIKKAIELGAYYICIANNDILFTPNWEIPLINALDGEYSVVSPYSTERELPKDFPTGKDRHVNPNPLNILGCCFMYTVNFINECGYFPEDMVHYYGDNWICDIANHKALKIGHIEQSYIHHLYTKTTSSLPSSIFFTDKRAYMNYTKINNIVPLLK